MNKKVINAEIPYAHEALAACGIAKNGKIEKTYRGQISSFGAAVTMGSLLPAIVFFAKDADASDVNRSKLMDAILEVLKADGKAKAEEKDLYEYAYAQVKAGKEAVAKENIINAAISLKLAMNLYILVKPE